MVGGQKDYRIPFSIMMFVVGIAMLGWAIPYGYAGYKLDQCGQSVQARLDEINAKIGANRRALEQK
jgi:hypothetical protein